MNRQQAVMAYAQGDKIKAGIIWVSQAAEQAAGLELPERKGAEALIQSLLHMIAHEIHLASRLSPHPAWQKAAGSLDMAIVMTRSGVIREASFHLTQALTQVTTVAQQAMTLLHQEGLLT